MRGHTKTMLSLIVCISLTLAPTLAFGLVEWQNYEPDEANAVQSTGHMAKLELDSNDNPHMLWIDSGNPLYAHLTNDEWLCADGEPLSTGNAVVSTDTVIDGCLALDSNDIPHISWQSFADNGESDIYTVNYATWDGEWVNAEGETSDYTMITSDHNPAHEMALSTENKPSIVWCEMHGVSMIHLTDDGWETQNGGIFDMDNPESGLLFEISTETLSPSLSFDSQDNPRIAWQQMVHHEGFGEWDIMYCAWDGDNWVDGDGDEFDLTNSGVGVPAYSFMVLNPQLTTDIGDVDNLAYNYIGFGPTGAESNVVYLKTIGDGWRCADDTPFNSLDKTVGNPARVTSNGMSGSQVIAIDDAGRPHIAWSALGDETSDVLYTFNDLSQWVCADGSELNDSVPLSENSANLSYNDSFSCPTSIVVDSDGHPHIAWVDNAGGEPEANLQISYVRWDGDEWVTLIRD
jgi:hypothetical protein